MSLRKLTIDFEANGDHEMFNGLRRDRKREEFLSRELYRSELRTIYIIRQLTDDELQRIGVTQFDRDSEDWQHRAIVQVDELAISANIASHRMQGMSLTWIRNLWPHRNQT
jgi:hypothetical protein